MVIVWCRIILSDHFAQFCVCKLPLGKKLYLLKRKFVTNLISLKMHLFIISSTLTQTLSMEMMSINLSLSSITNLIVLLTNMLLSKQSWNVKWNNLIKAWISKGSMIAVCKENELFCSGDQLKYNLQLYTVEIKSSLCLNSARNYVIISALNINKVRHKVPEWA